MGLCLAKNKQLQENHYFFLISEIFWKYLDITAVMSQFALQYKLKLLKLNLKHFLSYAVCKRT